MSQSLITREDLKKELADQHRSELEALLPPRLPIKRFLDLADLAVRDNPDILKCTMRSVVKALYACARSALEPGVDVHLVPYGSECQTIINYHGTLTLLHQTPVVQRCFSEIVFENDAFAIDYGNVDKPFTHKPKTHNRGRAIGAYGAIVFKDGGVQVHYMHKEDLQRVRNLSKMSEKGSWKDHEQEMWRKVALKVTAKQCPLTPQVQAAFADDEVGDPQPVSAEQAATNIQELFGERVAEMPGQAG